MRGFTIYQIYAASPSFFRTRKEAEAAAKQALVDVDFIDEVDIERCLTVPMTVGNVIAIIANDGGSWCADSVVVKTIKRKAVK